MVGTRDLDETSELLRFLSHRKHAATRARILHLRALLYYFITYEYSITYITVTEPHLVVLANDPQCKHNASYRFGGRARPIGISAS